MPLSPRQRLAVVSTHPIQYHAPWFRALAADPRVDLEVLFCHQSSREDQARAGFGVQFEWDVPLLEGYPHRFLKNVSSEPSASTFKGLDTPEIGAELARGKYDAVLLNGWHFKSAWQTLFACWRQRLPVMVRGDSHLHSPRAAWKQAVKSLGYRPFIRRFDACLPVGTWSADYFRAYGARKERIFIVPHTLDEERYQLAAAAYEPRREELRAAWNLPSESCVFLFAGKFVSVKRPLDFVEAVALAARQGPAAGLMVGDGPLRAECERRAAELQAPITFAGFLNQSEMVRSYVAADVLVLCSDSETWGLVVNEAMTCGRGCLVSDQVGCGPDLALSGQTGDIFPTGNVPELAARMARMAAEPEETRAMGQRARRHIQHFSISTAVEGAVQALQSVCRKPAR